MSYRPAPRNHLRLATAPVEPTPGRNRFVALVLAFATWIVIRWRSAAAFIGAALALLPLAMRRAPLGRRARPLPPREARIIPFQRNRPPQAMRR